jgi:hypothetical protein
MKLKTESTPMTANPTRDVRSIKYKYFTSRTAELLIEIEKLGDAREHGSRNFGALARSITEVGCILIAQGWTQKRTESIISFAALKLLIDHEDFVEHLNENNQEARGRPQDSDWSDEREYEFYIAIRQEVLKKEHSANWVIGEQWERWGAESDKKLGSLKNRYYRLRKRYDSIESQFEYYGEDESA